MKKKMLLLAALAACTAILATGTLAYYTADDQVHNVITTNSVDIEIVEWQKDGDDLVPYPKDEPIPIMPGTTVSKIAAVKNNQAESYIRAKVDIVFSKGSPSNAMELSPETLASLVSLSMNTDDWEQRDGAATDDWWYYKDSVNTDETTEPLFTEVKFSGPNMTNEYQNCKVEVIVSAQAVQADNNATNANAAKGWPEE